MFYRHVIKHLLILEFSFGIMRPSNSLKSSEDPGTQAAGEMRSSGGARTTHVPLERGEAAWPLASTLFQEIGDLHLCPETATICCVILGKLRGLSGLQFGSPWNRAWETGMESTGEDGHQGFSPPNQKVCSGQGGLDTWKLSWGYACFPLGGRDPLLHGVS